jgi:pimeloyl-ACP methyl ester carboxylesterase
MNVNASEPGSVSRDGDEIYFESVGAPDAPVVVLGHGAGGNHAIWYQQVPVFARDYRVITWDQRGFGLSTHRNEHANPRTAIADLLAILDHLGVERAHVVGQSLGGWAALGLALAHADRVRSLVLADTIAGIAIPEWWKAAVQSQREGAFNHPALADRFCRDHPERAHLYLQIGGLKRDANPDQLAVLRGLREVSHTDDELAGCGVPTMFIVGTEDEIFPPATIADAARRVPGARVEQIAGAGHSPYFEQPEAWNALVLGFWENNG